MEAVLLSAIIVAVAEIGDKTQLLAILLAARFRQPWIILSGITLATMVNHALAALIGSLAAEFLSGPWFEGILGAGFIAMAGWALIPDKPETPRISKGSVFWATAIAFFLVEMGDKTQIATALLAARYQNVLLVTVGTTLGMVLVNAPAVWLGERIVRLVPLHFVRFTAAALFAIFGVWIVLFGM